MKYCEKCLAKKENLYFFVMTLQTSCGAERVLVLMNPLVYQVSFFLQLHRMVKETEAGHPDSQRWFHVQRAATGSSGLHEDWRPTGSRRYYLYCWVMLP